MADADRGRGRRLTEEQGRGRWVEVAEAESRFRPSASCATVLPSLPPLWVGGPVPAQYPFAPTLTPTPLHPNSHAPGAWCSCLQLVRWGEKCRSACTLQVLQLVCGPRSVTLSAQSATSAAFPLQRSERPQECPEIESC